MDGTFRVLLLDDPDRGAQTAVRLAEGADYLTIETVYEAGDCLDRLRSQPPDCLVCNADHDAIAEGDLLGTVDREFTWLPVVLFRSGRDALLGAATLADDAVDDLDGPGSRWQYADLGSRIRRATVEAETRQAVAEDRYVLSESVDALEDLFYVCDRDGNITMWNDAAVTVTGYDPDTIAGRSPTEFVGEADVPAVEDAIEEARETGSATVEVDLVTSTGETRPYEFTKSRLTDSTGDHIGYTGIGRDVSDRRFREEQMAVLQRFLRHNLRNELNVVLGHAELLESTQTDGGARDGAGARHDARPGDDAGPTRRESAAVIAERSRNLLNVADTVRMLENLLSTDRDRDRVPVDVVDSVRSAVASVERSAPGVEVSLDCPEVAHARVHGRFPTAVEQLVVNAVEHNDRREPALAVGVETDDEAIRVTVADDGPGIPPEEREVLAGRCTETPLSHSEGLGLYLVRWIVDASGGSVVVTDRDPRGTAVTLSVPAAEGDGDGDSGSSAEA